MSRNVYINTQANTKISVPCTTPPRIHADWGKTLNAKSPKCLGCTHWLADIHNTQRGAVGIFEVGGWAWTLPGRASQTPIQAVPTPRAPLRSYRLFVYVCFCLRIVKRSRRLRAHVNQPHTERPFAASSSQHSIYIRHTIALYSRCAESVYKFTDKYCKNMFEKAFQSQERQAK